MKKSFISICLIIVSNLIALAQNNELRVNPKLSSVKVFTVGAQLQHKAQVDLNKGITTLVFTQLSSQLDIKNVNVEATSPDIKLLSVSAHKNYLDSKRLNAKSEKLNDSLVFLTEKIEFQKKQIETLNKQQQLLYDICNNGLKTGSPDEIQKNIAFFRDSHDKIFGEIIKTKKNLDELSKLQLAYQNQLKEENSKQANTLSEIVVVVSSPEKKRCEFDIKYLASNAGWTAKYDIRIENTSTMLELLLKADVYNNTGIDWSEIPFVLSTAQPQKQLSIPSLKPLDFGREHYIENKDELVKQTKIVAKNMVDTVVSYTAMLVPEFSVEFPVDLTFDILADAKPYTIDLKQYNTEVKFQYIAIPKMEEVVYLSALLPNWQDLNLMSGDANIFLNGAFVSRTDLFIGSEDTLRISLGQDNNVKVLRNKIKGDTREAIIGNNVKYSFAFELVVQNQYNFPVNVQIIDQIPISTDKDVVIEVFNVSNAEVDDNGLLYWHLNLAAKSSDKRLLSYSLKYPESKRRKYTTAVRARKAAVPAPMFD